MLIRFQRILLLPFGLVRPSWELSSLSAGMAEDLAHGMNCLGGVRVTMLPRVGQPTIEGSVPQFIEYSDDQAVQLVEEHGVDQVLVGKLGALSDGLGVVVRLLDSEGESLWSGEVELRDGDLAERRAGLFSDLVGASSGQARHGSDSEADSPTSIEAYKRVLAALDPRVDGRVCRTLLEEAVSLDPGWIDAHLLLARTWAQQGEAWRTLEGLEQAVDRFPDAARVWQSYAVALRVAGRRSESREAAQAVLDRDPDGHTLFHAGLFAAAGADHEMSTAAYEQAVDLGCVDPVLFENLGHELARRGNDEDALALWDAALEMDPSLLRLLGERALAMHRLGRDADAQVAFDDALSRASDLFPTHACRAHWLQARGMHEEAVEGYSAALQHRRDDPLMLNGRGVSRHLLGDEQAARTDFEQALVGLSRGRPGGLRLYVRENLARLDRGALGLDDEAARRLGDGGRKVRDEEPEAAIPILQSSLALDGESSTAWLFLALAYRDLGDWQNAADALEEVVRREPDHAEALSEYSLVLLALRQSDAALERGHAAVEAAPDDPGILCNLGVVCMECGWLEEAREVFEEAAALDPADPITARCVEALDQRCRDERPWGEGDWA